MCVRESCKESMSSGLRRTLPNLARKPRILVCAPSNAATDELLQRIMDHGFLDFKVSHLFLALPLLLPPLPHPLIFVPPLSWPLPLLLPLALPLPDRCPASRRSCCFSICLTPLPNPAPTPPAAPSAIPTCALAHAYP